MKLFPCTQGWVSVFAVYCWIQAIVTSWVYRFLEGCMLCWSKILLWWQRVFVLKPWWGYVVLIFIVTKQMQQVLSAKEKITKKNSASTNRLAGSPHLKRHFSNLFAFCVYLRACCLGEMCLFLLLVLVVWHRWHYHSRSSWFWVVSLITWEKKIK